MCGIVGVINPKEIVRPSLERTFLELLYADTVRGPHSTGVFRVDKNKVEWRKAAVPAYEFMGLKNVPEFMKDIDEAKYAIGHNRWATRGEVNNKNAHPFQHKHITLVHNGTLYSTDKLSGDKKFSVDSEVIAHSFAQEGEEVVIPKLRGSFTLVWYNTKTKLLNLIRNADRPLTIAKTFDGIYFIASEREMLEWVLKRNKFFIQTIDNVPVDTMLSFSTGEEKPKVKEIKPKYEYQQVNYKPWDWAAERAKRWFGYPEGGDEVPAANEPAVSDVIALPRQGETSIIFSEAPTNKEAMRTGDTLFFSLFDYDDKVVNSKFIPIIGEFPVDQQKNYVIRGNFNGTSFELSETKNLLTGRLSAIMWNRKENKYQLDVSNVKISERIDPFYDKTNKIKQGNIVSFAPKEEKGKPLQTMTKCHSKTCDILLDPTSKKTSESGVIVYKSGGARRYCIECYTNDPSLPAAVNQH